MTSLTHSMTPSLPNFLLTTLKSTPPSLTPLTTPTFKTTSTSFIHGHLHGSFQSPTQNATYSKLANASNRSTITRSIYHKFHSLHSNPHLTLASPSISLYLSIIISKLSSSVRTNALISYTDVSSPKIQPHFSAHTKFMYYSNSYITPAWSPHEIGRINSIEAVQCSFTKRISGLRDTSYADRLSLLGLRSLEHRRLISDLATCFNIVHCLCSLEFAHFFTFSHNPFSRGHSLHPFHLPKPIPQSTFPPVVLSNLGTPCQLM